MKLCKLIILVSLLFLLGGCYDNLEPNEYAYVTAIGVDSGQNDNYNFTVQFAKPAQISGGSSEEGGKGGDIIENVTVEAPNIYSAVGLVNDIISKNLNLAHMKLLVFSKDIAEQGIENFLETVVRSEDIKPSVYVAVCLGETKKYLNDIKPIVEINPAKYYQMIYDKKDFGAVPKTNGMEVYFDVAGIEKNAVVALAGVAEMEDTGKSQNGGADQGGGGQTGDGTTAKSSDEATKENKEENSVSVNDTEYEFGIRDYKAGEIGVFKETRSEAIGSAVFKDGKMINTLGAIETDIYNLLINEFTSDYLSVKSPKSQFPITINVTKTENTSIKYNRSKHTADIKISLEGEFISLPDDYIAENDIREFEKLVNTAVTERVIAFLEKTKTEFNSDIVGFGKQARTDFLTYKDFDDFDWESKYKNLNFRVETDFKLRRTGLTRRR